MRRRADFKNVQFICFSPSGGRRTGRPRWNRTTYRRGRGRERSSRGI